MPQRISITVTDEMIEQARTLFGQLDALFNMLVALPPAEAQKLFKVGQARRGLPDDGLAGAEANPDILPPGTTACPNSARTSVPAAG